MGQGRIRLDSLTGGDRRGAILSFPDGSQQKLWFHGLDGALPTGLSDPFLLGSLMLFMRHGGELHVEGPVSRRLLAGLEEWQEAWALWRPNVYRTVRMSADEVVTDSPRSPRAIAAFSGGVDAAFTVRRHLTGLAGWRTAELAAGLLVQGFEIPLEQDDVFHRARDRAATMLAGSELELLSLRTNIGQLGLNWADAFGLATAACLTLYAPNYGIGLLGSSEPYDHLLLPWGSHPITDHLMSSGSMEVRHDGAGASRTEKVRLLASWPEARANLRVCHAGEHMDRNCGRCEKCVRTVLNFRAIGAGLPECFEEDVTDEQIRAIALPGAAPQEWASLLEEAKTEGRDDSWVRAVRFAIRSNRAKDLARTVPGVQRTARTVRRLKEHRSTKVS